MNACDHCDRPHYAKSLCQFHYGRARNNGHPLAGDPLHGATTVERFWAKVQVGPECWLWTGALTKAGYPSFRAAGNNYGHRYSYELHVGHIPAGLELDHLCQVPACVNPQHLEPVTKDENKRRVGERRLACPQGHPYTPENTKYEVDGGRKCLTCRRLRDLERRPSKARMAGVL